MREPVDFDGAVALFERSGFDSLLSATSVPDFNTWRPDHEARLESFTYDYKNRGRRQDKTARDLNTIRPRSGCSSRRSGAGTTTVGRIGVYPMAFWKSSQIDEEEVLRFCAALMREHVLFQPALR